MADTGTPKTEAQLLTSFHDNTTGDIIPSNVRDFVASCRVDTLSTIVTAFDSTDGIAKEENGHLENLDAQISLVQPNISTIQVDTAAIKNSISSINIAVNKATTAPVGAVYDGGGVSNALQVAVTTASLIALSTKPTAISITTNNILQLFLGCTSNAATATLIVLESNGALATSTIVNAIPVSVESTNVFTIDEAAFGFTPSVSEIAIAKYVPPIPVTPGNNAFVFVASTSAGTWYARQTLFGSV